MTVLRRLVVSIVAVVPLAGPVFADDVGSRGNPLGVAHAASDATLASMRGGFDAGGGLQVGFGIERAVYVNGTLVTTTSLNVADATTAQATRAFGLIQSGANNSFAGAIGSASASTIIQNSLDNQRIQGITTINATANSLDLVKRSDLSTSIQGALTGSLRR